MALPTDDIFETALDWHLRQADLSQDEWHRFVAWLEADPRHAATFDSVAALDRHLTPEALAPRPLAKAANDDRPVRRVSRFAWIGGGAAAAAAAAALFLVMPGKADLYTVATRAGETRTIALSDGTRIELSGGSRLVLDRGNPRFAALDAGEAVFHVRHDAGAPFTVHSGKLAVQDVGTVFDVMRDGRRFDVQVSEGAVMFQPDKEAVRLGPGLGLSVDEDRHEVKVDRVATDLVGGWRNGRLSFSGEPIAQVARTIGRLYGTILTVDYRLSGTGVTGIISLSGEASRDVPYIASLVGANWHKDGERWILSPMDSQARP